MRSPTPSTIRRLTAALPITAASLTGLAAAAVLITQVTGSDELSTNPALPWWSAIVAAAFAAIAFAAKPSRARAATWAIAGTLLALTAVFRLPYDLLSVISAILATMTNGTPYFEVVPAWGATGTHLLVGLAAAAAITTAVVEARRVRGACVWCGAAPRTAARAVGTWATVAALIAVVTPLPYLALKLAWSAGSNFGLADADTFAGIAFTTPGFGDTVLLGVLGMLAAGWMATGRAGGVLRWVAVGVGAAGSAMLLPVGTLGVVLLGAAQLGIAGPGPGPLHFWVFAIVYPSFFVWGAALAAATIGYWRRTRRPCPLRNEVEHGIPGTRPDAPAGADHGAVR